MGTRSCSVVGLEKSFTVLSESMSPICEHSCCFICETLLLSYAVAFAPRDSLPRRHTSSSTLARTHHSFDSHSCMFTICLTATPGLISPESLELPALRLTTKRKRQDDGRGHARENFDNLKVHIESKPEPNSISRGRCLYRLNINLRQL